MKEIPHSSPDLQQIYRQRFSGTLEHRRKVWQVLASRFFSRWISPDAVVLDLGCGYCEFINSISAVKKYGIDLNPDSDKRAAPDVVIFEQDCSMPWPIPERSLDVIFTSNFFEPLPTKAHLEKTLQQAWISLKKGGILIAMGPNIKFLHGAYWDFYDHHIPLTDLALVEVMKKCHFNIESARPRFLPYNMSNRAIPPLWMLRLYLILPPIWRLFGKQFLIIGRKT
jgi:SAM-dependent methyltransferase